MSKKVDTANKEIDDNYVILERVNKNLTDLTAKVVAGDYSSHSLTVSCTSVTGGVSITAKSDTDTQLSFRIILIPVSVYAVTGATYSDAMNTAQTGNYVNRNYETSLRWDATHHWVVNNMSFYTSQVSLVKNTSTVWTVNFAPIMACNVYVEPLYGMSTSTSTGGGI